MDQLPISAYGGILDIHITAFLSSIDSLLNCARSTTPTSVLTPMKAVVNAVASILDDIRVYEEKIELDKAILDVDNLYSLRERAKATLSNLVTASKTHATSLGMSPVSLLDAAASHLSATVTDLGKIVFIRRATKAEQEEYLSSPQEDTGKILPEEQIDLTSERALLVYDSRLRTDGVLRDATSGAFNTTHNDTFRKPGSNSSSDSSSPPPLFDRHPARTTSAILSDDSLAMEGSDEAWSELKVCIQNYLSF